MLKETPIYKKSGIGDNKLGRKIDELLQKKGVTQKGLQKKRSLK